MREEQVNLKKDTLKQIYKISKTWNVHIFNSTLKTSYHCVRLVFQRNAESSMEKVLQMDGKQINAECKPSQRHEHTPAQESIDNSSVAFDTSKYDPAERNCVGKSAQGCVEVTGDFWNVEGRIVPRFDCVDYCECQNCGSHP